MNKKIINIASNDNLQDVLGAIENTRADDLVLVVPRSNKVFKRIEQIRLLKKRIFDLNKNLTVFTSDPYIIEILNSEGIKTTQEIKGRKQLSGKEVDQKIKKRKNKLMTDIIPLRIKKGFSPPRLLEKKETNKKASFKREDFNEYLGKEDEFELLYRDRFKEEPKKLSIQKFPQQKNFFKKIIWLFLILAIALFLFIIFTSISRARIIIKPQKEQFSLNLPLTISNDFKELDLKNGLIPGEILEIKKNLSQEFQSTGEKELFQKAKGRVVIYNNFGTESQILVATTRLQTPEGLIFRIPKTIKVPGGKIIDGKLQPGQIETEVIADKSGSEYNIDPTDFTIPGFLGTPKYQGFYAKSLEKFSGGSIGKTRYVTEEDYKKAKEKITEDLKIKLKEELLNLKEFKILDEITEITINEDPLSSKAMDLGEKFNIILNGSIKTIGFKEENIKEFVRNYFKNSEQRIVLDQELSLNYLEPKINKGEESMNLSLNLNVFGFTVRDINKELIINDILGKSEKDLREYFGSKEEIESVQIFLSPFWVKNVPRDSSRVEIKIEF